MKEWGGSLYVYSKQNSIVINTGKLVPQNKNATILWDRYTLHLLKIDALHYFLQRRERNYDQ